MNIKIEDVEQIEMLNNIIIRRDRLITIFNEIKNTSSINKISLEDKFTFLKYYNAFIYVQEIYRDNYNISDTDMSEIINISLEDMCDITDIYTVLVLY